MADHFDIRTEIGTDLRHESHNSEPGDTGLLLLQDSPELFLKSLLLIATHLTVNIVTIPVSLLSDH